MAISGRMNQAKSPRPTPAGTFPFLLKLVATWRFWLPRAALIAGLVIWIYAPAFHGDFIWDDQWYVTTNPLLTDPHGLWTFWTAPGKWVEYYPIHETVLWSEWNLWGTNTLGYHLVDVLLHIVNALLVWHLFNRLRLRYAWLGGLLFAVHPVQVESVAYISELKNTLAMPFYLITLCSWIDYEETKSRRDYAKALGFFLVGMLCKISLAPFAAVILLYAWWKRGRIAAGDLKACAPFLLIAMALGYLTIWTGEHYETAHHAQIGASPITGILSRLDAAGLNTTVYFARCFLPVDIMFVYSQWPLHPHQPLEYLPWLVLAGVLVVLWNKRRGWGRHALLGLGFFLLFLSPFVGLTPVSYMNFIWVLDHFLYLPMLGLLGLVIAACGGIDAQLPKATRPLTLGIFAALVAVMAWTSHAFAGLFVNEVVLWNYIIDRNPTVWLAHDNLGDKLLELERYPESLVQIQQALAIRPNYWDGYHNRGLVYEKTGHPDWAEGQYLHALQLNPDDLNGYLFLGEIRRHAGRFAEAEDIYRQGLQRAPEDTELNIGLAGLLFQMGRAPEAIEFYQTAAETSPDMAQLQYDLGVALMQTHDLPQAAAHLQRATELAPAMEAAHKNFGAVLAQLGHFPEAIGEFQTALQLSPGDGTSRKNLALALVQTGHIPEAIEQFQAALQADPNDAQAREAVEKLQQFELKPSAPVKN